MLINNFQTQTSVGSPIVADKLSFRLSGSDDIVLPRFVAQYRFNPSLMAYGSIAMDNSRQGNAGYDYTLQITIIFVGSLLAGAGSGFIAESLGYPMAFAIASGISLLGVLLVLILPNTDLG